MWLPSGTAATLRRFGRRPYAPLWHPPMVPKERVKRGERDALVYSRGAWQGCRRRRCSSGPSVMLRCAWCRTRDGDADGEEDGSEASLTAAQSTSKGLRSASFNLRLRRREAKGGTKVCGVGMRKQLRSGGLAFIVQGKHRRAYGARWPIWKWRRDKGNSVVEKEKLTSKRTQRGYGIRVAVEKGNRDKLIRLLENSK